MGCSGTGRARLRLLHAGAPDGVRGGPPSTMPGPNGSLMLGDRDREKAGRAMNAMLKMNKIDIAALERAAAGD